MKNISSQTQELVMKLLFYEHVRESSCKLYIYEQVPRKKENKVHVCKIIKNLLYIFYKKTSGG